MVPTGTELCISVRQNYLISYLGKMKGTIWWCRSGIRQFLTVIYKFNRSIVINRYFISRVLGLAKTTPVVVFGCTEWLRCTFFTLMRNFLQGDEENPQLVVEYVTDIYNYLRYLESIQAVTPDYLAGQQVGDRDCCLTAKSFWSTFAVAFLASFFFYKC